MKKMIVMLALAGTVSCATELYGQAQDTLKTQQEQGNEYTKGKDWTAVAVSDVPTGLRQSLQASEYKGWDLPTSMIYRNAVTNYYLVEIHDGTKTKSFRFDKDGRPVKD